MSIINIGIAGNTKSIAAYLPYLKAMPMLHLVGTFDTTDDTNFKEFYGLKPFTDFIKRTDAIIFCGSYPINFYSLVEECVRFSKHILIEKFPNFDSNELLSLQKLLREADVKLFISNINGTAQGYTAARQYISRPSHIMANINVPFNKPLNNIAMQQHICETIDMALRNVASRVSKVKVNRQYIFNQQADILKMNILFDNGCSADISYHTFSQVASSTYHIYQKGKIIALNLETQKVEETRLDIQLENQLDFNLKNNSAMTVSPKVEVFEKKILYFDAIQKDLLNFVDCITNHISPLVGIDELIEVVNVLQQLQYSEHEEFV